jgi:O-antigen/teichoic acid export membrane protein
MRLARNVSLTFATSMLSTGCTALAALVVATVLGPAGAGTFALARAVPAVATLLLGLGVPIAITYLVGGRRMPLQDIADTSLFLGLTIGAAGLAAWVVGTVALQARFFAALTAPQVLLLGVIVPATILRNQLNAILQGLQRFTEANAALFAEDLVGLLVVLPLIVRRADGPALIVLAAVAGPVASLIASACWVRRSGVRFRPRANRRRCEAMIRFGVKGHIGRMANVLNWRLDLILLSTMTNLEVVGYYAVATKVAEALRPLAGSLNFVLRPLMSSLPADEAGARSAALYRRFFVVNGVAILVVALACGEIIRRLFGAAFVPAIPACQILLFGLAFQGGDGILNGYHVGIGRPELNTWAALAGLAVTVTGNPLLIPTYSLLGAAATSAIAYTAKSLVMIALFLHASGFTLGELAGIRRPAGDVIVAVP